MVLITARPSKQIANEQDWNAPLALPNTYKIIWRTMKIVARFKRKAVSIIVTASRPSYSFHSCRTRRSLHPQDKFHTLQSPKWDRHHVSLVAAVML